MEKQGDFQYEYFSSVTQHKVEWLWYPYIPYGKLTILQGDPGEGKSTFILNVAALLTRGKDMPDGFRVPEAQRVVYQTAEDNIADTVKPRLVAAGADCGKVAYIPAAGRESSQLGFAAYLCRCHCYNRTKAKPDIRAAL